MKIMLNVYNNVYIYFYTVLNKNLRNDRKKNFSIKYGIWLFFSTVAL